MSPILVGLIALLCSYASALAGMALHSRLPAQHKDDESKDVIKLVMGLIATIAALVLSLLIATAHTSYDRQESEVQELGLHIVQLDRILVQYGPETAEARSLLRQIVATDVELVWPSTGRPKVNLRASTNHEKGEKLAQLIAGLAPTTDVQRFVKSRALQLVTNLSDTRGLLTEQAGGSLAWPFFAVLIFWLVVLFLGFGFLTRPNATVLVALFVGALSVGGAIFLILDMNQPYSGLMQISPLPIRSALTAISQ